MALAEVDTLPELVAEVSIAFFALLVLGGDAFQYSNVVLAAFHKGVIAGGACASWLVI